jgi:regulator of protease activity HflC (stomatin/prohibitin superfamily)
MGLFSWLSVLALVWFICGFGIVRENERIVKIRLGRPYAVKESGVFWIPFLIAWVRRYTTKVVELQLARRDENFVIKRDADGRPIPAGGFITARDSKVGPLNVGVTLSYRFNWPADEAKLIQCVKLLPDPSNIPALTDLFQEIILDETRSVGCKMSYIAIMSDRAGFAKQITASVTQGEASQLLTDTGLEPSAHVVIDHIDIPEEALKALDDEEAQRLKAEGVRRKAEGDKDRIRLEDEGRAAGYRAIKAEGPEAMELESYRTLREMAQGTSNTIFVPIEGLKNLLSNFIRK